MRVVVGSTNPVKVAAVKNIVKKVWPEAAVEFVHANPGISDMPLTDEESILGATNRARHALEKTNADLALGLEGSVVDSKDGMFLTGWTVALHKDGRRGIGGGTRTLLPERIASELRKGRELGLVIDEVIGGHDTKKKQGTVGVLTDGLLERTEGFEHQVINALSVFVREELYE